MSLSSRMFAGVADRDRIIRLLSETLASDPTGPSLHPGSIMWDMYLRADVDPGKRFRLWEDGDTGALLAMGWLEKSADEIAMQLATSVYGTELGAAIVAEGMAWARSEADRAHVPDLWARAYGADTWYIEQLLANGCTVDPNHAYYIHFQQSLTTPPSDAPLLAGFSVRAVSGLEEWQRRVDVHRAAFAPSRFTVEGYRNVRATPNYRGDLDLVAVAPNGDFAAYCLVWYDEASRVGEYEPVGAHPDWRRQGVTRAVVTEGLRRLHALGAKWAIVLTSSENTPAVRLYESCGFTKHDDELYYRVAR